MKSATFEAFRLSDFECGVRDQYDQLSRLFPVMTMDKAPVGSKVSGLNTDLSAMLTENISKPQLGRKRHDELDQT
jgi:hypothetical protein